MDLSQFNEIFKLFNINGGTTLALAGTVSIILAFLKKYIPLIQGRYAELSALILSILLSIKAYWMTAPTNGPDIMAMIFSSLFVWTISLGSFELVKKMSGTSNNSPVK